MIFFSKQVHEILHWISNPVLWHPTCRNRHSISKNSSPTRRNLDSTRKKGHPIRKLRFQTKETHKNASCRWPFYRNAVKDIKEIQLNWVSDMDSKHPTRRKRHSISKNPSPTSKNHGLTRKKGHPIRKPRFQTKKQYKMPISNCSWPFYRRCS
ncbi:hypothetical protein QFZ72_000489 [Bacillus sp. V2I10]|nr:hypothetical protein [Bacillus sp. V2I10]